MKPARNDNRSTKRTLAVILTLFVVAATGVGIYFAWRSLRATWLERCLIRDVSAQINVITDKMIPADAIREAMELRKGENLALIDFGERREKTLMKYPIIRTLTVVRHLPDRVDITVTRREPVVRVNTTRERSVSGRVADSEGVVFKFKRPDLATMPVIRESTATSVGSRLEGRSLAALRLLEMANDREFSDLRILEVDTSKPDYLYVTLGGNSYQRAKIAWEGMDGANPGNQALRIQLQHLAAARRSKIVTGTTEWDVTLPGEVFTNAQQGGLK